MNNRELRAKYGDFVKSNFYTYPDHFFSQSDHFTMHIPNWNLFLEKYKDLPNLLFLEIGTAAGRSGVWMLENILTHDTSKLITVDIEENCFYKKGTKCKNIEFEEDTQISVKENFNRTKINATVCYRIQNNFLKNTMVLCLILFI